MSVGLRRAVLTRRAALACVSGTVGMLYARRGLALEPEVPLRLQVSLLDRVIPYDRNFSVRVHGQVLVVVVVDTTSPDSVRTGALLLGELSSQESLGSYPFTTKRVAFESSQELMNDCKRLRAGIVYITPGIREPVAKLAAALAGLRVLTAGTMPDQAAQGMVFGTAVRSGRPRVLVNLTQARLQEVDFRADFLRMAEVVP